MCSMSEQEAYQEWSKADIHLQIMFELVIMAVSVINTEYFTFKI